MSNNLSMSCHCGAQSYSLEISSSSDGKSLSVCHCNTCRWTTGALCTSYIPIARPPAPLSGITTYTPGDGLKLLFCSTCGCHLFREASTNGAEEWEVTSGVLTAGQTEGETRHFEEHLKIDETRDGGLARWLQPGNLISNPPSPPARDSSPFLPASCHCGTVSFRVARPSATSRLPTSNYPDLMLPYESTSPEVISNPSDDKWWLPDDGTRFLAGTCACRSCRTTLGFEIQSWAFVPRTDITFRTPSRDGGAELAPLDFDELHRRGVLRGYISSEGVVREFCPRCGATVFWHDRWRPELIDVSVGLLRAESGVLAEDWLRWWTGRVSFEEDARLGRTGATAERGERLISMLRDGLERDRT